MSDKSRYGDMELCQGAHSQRGLIICKNGKIWGLHASISMKKKEAYYIYVSYTKNVRKNKK